MLSIIVVAGELELELTSGGAGDDDCFSHLANLDAVVSECIS
jgi:hypothetical protein